MAQITSPNKEYNGVSNGVQFTNGVGETSDQEKINWFLERGYTVDGQSAGNVEAEAIPFAEANAGAAEPQQENATAEGIQTSQTTKSKK